MLANQIMSGTKNMMFSTDAQRWDALIDRNRQGEGAFVYAVRTTGVYCRPTCPSRLPNRANVAFFVNWIEAERAGFHACKRCTPNAASLTPRADVIIRACKFIEAAEEPPRIKAVAAAVGLSVFRFQRLFKEVVGITPKAYIVALRARRIRDGLDDSASITQAIYDAGFGSSSRFYEGGARVLGMTPTKYKGGAAGLEIRFAITQSFLGLVLVAATERGICAIDFGDTREALTKRLHVRFPRAKLSNAEPPFAAWVAQVTAFIETPRRGLDLPLDIQGTAFQQRVWKALQTIPPGATASYSEVAEQIGRPAAVRAVARACASNTIAVAIPCHRVVRRDGDIGDYRWGIKRKRALLKCEAKQTKTRRREAF